MSVTERTIAVLGAPETLPPISGVLATSLSAETALRSGFDVMLVETPETRRDAAGLLRLMEEAGSRVAFPRWLRRMIRVQEPRPLVSMVAGLGCDLAHLVDLALWLSGSRGVQRIESERCGPALSLSLRGHAGQLMHILTSGSLEGVRVTGEGTGEAVDVLLPWVPPVGLERELEIFSNRPEDAVLLEDSMDVVTILERVARQQR